MAVITLLTDWGIKDYYTSIVKACLYKYCPNIPVFDISHEIDKFDIAQAAYVLQNTYFEFPKGSVHISGLSSLSCPKDPSKDIPREEHLLIEHKGHYFIGLNDGFFPLVFEEELPSQVYTFDVPKSSFPARDFYPELVAKIFEIGDLSRLDNLKPATLKEEILRQIPLLASSPNQEGLYDKGMISGQISYIDHFGNLHTNISKNDFELFSSRYKYFEIWLRDEKLNIIMESYQDQEVLSGIIALFGSNNKLQIALKGSSASNLLGIRLLDTIRILFLN